MWHFHIRKASLLGSSFNIDLKFIKLEMLFFYNSFKRCLTYYIEMLKVVGLLIPPKSEIKI